MKKRIKSLLLTGLMVFPMVFGGCENPFGGGNLPENNNDYVQDDPSGQKPGGGGGGNSGGGGNAQEQPPAPTLYNPYDYEDGSNPYKELSSSMAYVKAIYKQNTSSVDPTTLIMRKEAYLAAADKVLSRMSGEYGWGASVDGVTINPLSNVGQSVFTSTKLLGSGFTSTAAEREQVVHDFMHAQYIRTFTNAGSMKYTVISTNGGLGNSPISFKLNGDSTGYVLETACSSFETVFAKTGNPVKSLDQTTYLVNENDAFYKVTKSNGTVIYVVYNNNFAENLGTYYDKIVDTHRDGIRYNKVSLTGSSDSSVTIYNLVKKGWAIYEKQEDISLRFDGGNASAFTTALEYETAFKNKYKKDVAIQIASVMTFGLNDKGELKLPSSKIAAGSEKTIKEYYEEATAQPDTYFDEYMAFCLKYIEHNGFVAYEADAISDFLVRYVVGEEVLGLEADRFVQNAFVDTSKIVPTFNSNEKVVVDGTTYVRLMIANYNNTNVRAVSKNEVFSKVNYRHITDMIDTHSSYDVLSYKINGESKSDERRALFKNYLNTFYSAVYALVTGSTDDIVLEYCDIDYSYLQNTIIVDEEMPEGDEESGDEGGEEEEEETEDYILDEYLGGKLQSILIFPEDPMEIRYFEVGLQADLKEGQQLFVTADLRYHVGGQVFYAEGALKPEGGTNYITADENILNFEYQSGLQIGSGVKFRTSSNEIVNEKLLSFDNCVSNIPDLRKKKLLFPIPNDVGKKNAISSEFNYNKYTAAMGANYVYNGQSGVDFIEVCFNVTTDYKDFDTNYKMHAKVTSVYGQKK